MIFFELDSVRLEPLDIALDVAIISVLADSYPVLAFVVVGQ